MPSKLNSSREHENKVLQTHILLFGCFSWLRYLDIIATQIPALITLIQHQRSQMQGLKWQSSKANFPSAQPLHDVNSAHSGVPCCLCAPPRADNQITATSLLAAKQIARSKKKRSVQTYSSHLSALTSHRQSQAGCHALISEDRYFSKIVALEYTFQLKPK